jgi:hypothetical protein
MSESYLPQNQLPSGLTIFSLDEALVLCSNSILGLAVLALATVAPAKTVASAKTAEPANPNFQIEHCTSFLPPFCHDLIGT